MPFQRPFWLFWSGRLMAWRSAMTTTEPLRACRGTNGKIHMPELRPGWRRSQIPLKPSKRHTTRVRFAAHVGRQADAGEGNSRAGHPLAQEAAACKRAVRLPISNGGRSPTEERVFAGSDRQVG